MIAGGGKSGYYLAKLLADFNISVKIIEIDMPAANISPNNDDARPEWRRNGFKPEDENIDEMDALYQ